MPNRSFRRPRTTYNVPLLIADMHDRNLVAGELAERAHIPTLRVRRFLRGEYQTAGTLHAMAKVLRFPASRYIGKIGTTRFEPLGVRVARPRRRAAVADDTAASTTMPPATPVLIDDDVVDDEEDPVSQRA